MAKLQRERERDRKKSEEHYFLLFINYFFPQILSSGDGRRQEALFDTEVTSKGARCQKVNIFWRVAKRIRERRGERTQLTPKKHN